MLLPSLQCFAHARASEAGCSIRMMDIPFDEQQQHNNPNTIRCNSRQLLHALDVSNLLPSCLLQRRAAIA
jgi:hypothetical protein